MGSVAMRVRVGLLLTLAAVMLFVHTNVVDASKHHHTKHYTHGHHNHGHHRHLDHIKDRGELRRELHRVESDLDEEGNSGGNFEATAAEAEQRRSLAEVARQEAESRRSEQEASRVAQEAERAALQKEMKKVYDESKALDSDIKKGEHKREEEASHQSGEEHKRVAAEAERVKEHAKRGETVRHVQDQYKATTSLLKDEVSKFKNQAADQLEGLLSVGKGALAGAATARNQAKVALDTQTSRLESESKQDNAQAHRVHEITKAEEGINKNIASLQQQASRTEKQANDAKEMLQAPVQKMMDAQLKQQSDEIANMQKLSKQTGETLARATSSVKKDESDIEALKGSLNAATSRVNEVEENEREEKQKDGELETFVHKVKNDVESHSKTLRDAQNTMAEIKKDMSHTRDRVSKKLEGLESQRDKMGEHLKEQYGIYEQKKNEMKQAENAMQSKAKELQKFAKDDVDEQETVRKLEEYLSKLEAKLELAEKGTLHMNLAGVKEYFNQMSTMIKNLSETSSSNAKKVDDHLGEAVKHVEHAKAFEQELAGREDTLMNRVELLHKRQSEDEALINFKVKSLAMEVEEKVHDKIRTFQERVDKGLGIVKQHTDQEFSKLNDQRDQIANQVDKLKGVLSRLHDQLTNEQGVENKLEEEMKDHENMSNQESTAIQGRVDKKLVGLQKLLEAELADMTSHESLLAKDSIDAAATHRIQDLHAQLQDFDHKSKMEIDSLRSELGQGVMGIQHILHEILLKTGIHHGKHSSPSHAALTSLHGMKDSKSVTDDMKMKIQKMLIKGGMSPATAAATVNGAKTVGELRARITGGKAGSTAGDIPIANKIHKKIDDELSKQSESSKVNASTAKDTVDALVKMGMDRDQAEATVKASTNVGALKRNVAVAVQAHEASQLLDISDPNSPVPSDVLKQVAERMRKMGVPPAAVDEMLKDGNKLKAKEVKKLIAGAAEKLAKKGPQSADASAHAHDIPAAAVGGAISSLAGHADTDVVGEDVKKAVTDALVAAGVPAGKAAEVVSGSGTVGDLKKKLAGMKIAGGAPKAPPSWDGKLSDEQNAMKILADDLISDGSSDSQAALKLIRVINAASGDPHVSENVKTEILAGEGRAQDALKDVRNQAQKMLHDAIASNDSSKQATARKILDALDKLDAQFAVGVKNLKNPPKYNPKAATTCVNSCIPDAAKSKKAQECVKLCTAKGAMSLDEQSNDSIKSLLKMGIGELGEMTDAQLEKRVNAAVAEAKNKAANAKKSIDGLEEEGSGKGDDHIQMAWDTIRGAQESVSAAQDVRMIMNTYKTATSNDTNSPTFQSLQKMVSSLQSTAKNLVRKAGEVVGGLKFGSGTNHQEVMQKAIRYLAEL